MINFLFVNWRRLTVFNIAVKAVTRADIAENQKSCRAAGKTFRHIGTGRFLTDGMQLKIGKS